MLSFDARASSAVTTPVNPERRFLLRHVQFDKTIARAAGHNIYDADGVAYLDALAQYGALPFGHDPPAIWQRLLRAHEREEANFVQPLLSPLPDELAHKLLSVLPKGMRYVTYVNSGTEATDGRPSSRWCAPRRSGH